MMTIIITLWNPIKMHVSSITGNYYKTFSPIFMWHYFILLHKGKDSSVLRDIKTWAGYAGTALFCSCHLLHMGVWRKRKIQPAQKTANMYSKTENIFSFTPSGQPTRSPCTYWSYVLPLISVIKGMPENTSINIRSQVFMSNHAVPLTPPLRKGKQSSLLWDYLFTPV